MKDQPRAMTTAEMKATVERLKREGRFPTPQRLLEVIGKARQQYQDKILAARERKPVTVTTLLTVKERTRVQHVLIVEPTEDEK